jgi:hypothetical protein
MEWLNLIEYIVLLIMMKGKGDKEREREGGMRVGEGERERESLFVRDTERERICSENEMCASKPKICQQRGRWIDFDDLPSYSRYPRKILING